MQKLPLFFLSLLLAVPCLLQAADEPAGQTAESAADSYVIDTEPAAEIGETSPGVEASLSEKSADEDLDALDPYVVTPEQKAGLDAAEADRESAGQIPAQRGDSQLSPGDAAGQTSAEEKPAPPVPHPLIKSFVESRYGTKHCTAPSWCGELVELRCLKTGDGPIYYYDNAQGKLLMTCGRACINPDPFDKRDCKACPYPPWVECRERAWREEQKLLRQAELEEIARLEAEEAERQARVDAILEQIRAIEAECNKQIMELEQQLDALD